MIKIKISAQRRFELECWLKEMDFVSIGYEEFLNILITNGFNDLEKVYLLRAWFIPYESLKEDLNVYDTSKPKMDEIKFISDLQKKYNTNRKFLIMRIREVRAINKYEKKLNENNEVMLQRKNK